MKIAFIFNSLSNTGTNIATRDLIYQLKKSYSIEIDIYFFDKVENELDINSPKKQIKFFDDTDFSSYQIVHSSNFRSDVYAFFKKMFKSKKVLPKYVTSVHSVIEDDLIFTHRKFVAMFVSPFWLNLKKNNDAIFVSSDSMFNHYRDFFMKKNLHTIEYGRSINPLIDFEVPQSDVEIISELRKEYKIIGTVGSLIKRKNYSATINLLKKHEDYAWLCLGLGEEYDNLMALIKENALEKRVAFLGFRTDSRPYYRYFDFFFHPSKSEGFALVIIDAMAHKTPMLLANLEVYKSIVKDDMAFYFDVENDTSLFAAFDRISKGAADLNKAIEKAYQTYEDKFSMEGYGFKHYKVFQNLVKDLNS